MKYIRQYFLAAVCIVLALSGCKDDWDERTSLLDPSLSDTDLYESITESGDLTTFRRVLATAGYQEYMASDRDIAVLTVFAPTDAAFNTYFQTVDKDEFFADADGLRAFLDRHIANTMHAVEQDLQPYRVKMWDGRRLLLDPRATSLRLDEDITFAAQNILCKNGVIHKINTVVPDRQDVWSLAKAQLRTTGDPLQLLNAITALDYRTPDLENSRINGYIGDRPTYDTLWTESNRILDIKDISNEDTVYTYVIVQDAGYIPLAAKYGRIYRRKSSQESDSLAVLNLNVDLIFEGQLALTSAGSYTNINGVAVQLDPANIVSKLRASNGYVYVMSDAKITFRNNKVRDIIIEGELTDYWDANFPYDGRYATLIKGDTFLRGKLWKTKYRTWASNNNVLVLGGFYREQGNNTDPLSIGGDRPNMYSMFTKARPEVFAVPYALYWRMGNDTEKDSTRRIAQRIYISSPEQSEVGMRRANTPLRVDNNEIYTQSYPDTAALYPERINGVLIEANRPTFAFYASIQDSMRYNYYLNNQYVHDTLHQADVRAWLLENDRYKDYGLLHWDQNDIPLYDSAYVYTDTGLLDSLNNPIIDSAYMTRAQYVAYMRDCYRDYQTGASAALPAYPPSKAYLTGLQPNRVTHVDTYDTNLDPHPDLFLMCAFADPTTGWTKSDYYTLSKYPNGEQQLLRTYAYGNGDYDTWIQNPGDASANRHEFTSYGPATLLITRNFTGVGTSNMFQQTVYVTIDYIRLVPNLDDIDE